MNKNYLIAIRYQHHLHVRPHTETLTQLSAMCGARGCVPYAANIRDYSPERRGGGAK